MMIAAALVAATLLNDSTVQQEEKETPSTSSIEFIPYLWLAGVKGTIGVSGLTANVGTKFKDLVGDLDAGFMIATKLHLHHWVITGDFNYLRLSADGETPGPSFSGASVETEMFMGALTLGYRLGMDGDGEVELFAGARAWRLDTELDFDAGVLPATSVSDVKSFIDPIVGVNLRYSLGKSWSLHVLVDIGGFDVSSRMTGQVIAGVSVRLSDHWALLAAYRYLSVDREDGGFRWQMAEHGFLFGIGLRF